jgi:hypothetical protein
MSNPDRRMIEQDSPDLKNGLSVLGKLLDSLTQDGSTEEKKLAELRRAVIQELPDKITINTPAEMQVLVNLAKRVSVCNDSSDDPYWRLFSVLIFKTEVISLTLDNFQILQSAIEEMPLDITRYLLNKLRESAISETGGFEKVFKSIENQHEKIVFIGLLRHQSSDCDALLYSQIIGAIIKELEENNEKTAELLSERIELVVGKQSLTVDDLKLVLRVVSMSSDAATRLIWHLGKIKEPTEETANVIAEIVKKDKSIGWTLIEKINKIDFDNPNPIIHPFVLAVQKSDTLQDREKILILSKFLGYEDYMNLIPHITLPIDAEIIQDIDKIWGIGVIHGWAGAASFDRLLYGSLEKTKPTPEIIQAILRMGTSDIQYDIVSKIEEEGLDKVILEMLDGQELSPTALINLGILFVNKIRSNILRQIVDKMEDEAIATVFEAARKNKL